MRARRRGALAAVAALFLAPGLAAARPPEPPGAATSGGLHQGPSRKRQIAAAGGRA
jgi:hypothetical protein